MEEKGKSVNSRRVVANIIDQLIFLVIGVVINYFVARMYTTNHTISSSDEFIKSVAWIDLLSCIINILFLFIWFTLIPVINKNKASVGKLLVGLKVIREDDKEPEFKNLFIRNVRMWINSISIIFPMILLIKPDEYLLYTILQGIYGFIAFVLYCYIAFSLSKGKILLHDKYGRTLVVDKLYDPNLTNYQTIEEIKEWADVKGFEKKEYQYKDENEKSFDEKNPTDDDYWN